MPQTVKYCPLDETQNITACPLSEALKHWGRQVSLLISKTVEDKRLSQNLAEMGIFVEDIIEVLQTYKDGSLIILVNGMSKVALSSEFTSSILVTQGPVYHN